MALNDDVNISFLLSGIYGVVPSSCYKLRSYLTIHLSKVAYHQQFNLPKYLRSRCKTCPYCYSPWISDTTAFKLLPSKKNKHKLAKNENEKGQLKELRNTMVLKCKVCTKKSFFSLVKKEPLKEVLKEETVLSVKKRKKKKKKDKFCGLVVNSCKNESLPETLKKKREEKMKQNTDSVCALKHPQSDIPKSEKTSNKKVCSKNKPYSSSAKSKKLVCNPFATQFQSKISKKKNQKLIGLKKAVQRKKNFNLAKKTLKDFLTLI